MKLLNPYEKPVKYRKMGLMFIIIVDICMIITDDDYLWPIFILSLYLAFKEYQELDADTDFDPHSIKEHRL